MPSLAKIAKIAKSFSRDEGDSLIQRASTKNIIGFFSPCENSGTTALVAHVAQALHTTTTPVVIIDLNFKTPTIYSYFVDEIDPKRSILRKLKTPVFDTQELVNYRSLGDIGVVSMTGGEVPADYCSVEDKIIVNIIKELATRYTYVLIDLGADLNADATLTGLCECHYVYTCVRPIAKQIERLMIDREVMNNIGYINLIYDVIQTNIIGNSYTPAEFKSDIGMNLIGNIPQDYDLMVAFDNQRFVSTKLKNRNVKQFYGVVEYIANAIRELESDTLGKAGGA